MSNATPIRKNEVTLIATKKAEDTTTLITNGVDSYPDDSFFGSYTTQGGSSGISVIEPTFKPGVLRALTTNNNVLSQCIEIMEVNCDGTGHSIELIPGMKENEEEKKRLEAFFDEPYPNRSMISIRRDLRCDLEATGNGYLEMIRNLAGDVIMMNHLPSDDIRLVRYDDPVMVTRTIDRGGKEVDVKIRARERRFVQLINGKKTYFKEFQASRELDRDTGVWAEEGKKLPIQKRASELLHFTMIKEAKTPYGVPRWINQLPSILGSRKAEEFNLDFFDSGGLPPVLVVVQGGYLGEGVKEALQAHLSGPSSSKHRAAIVEAISSSGSLDSSGSVKVTVERFGAERMQDAMFQNYDKNAEEHVRAAFRLPPLFTGKAQDYNFATALTGYMTAEAQVFGPERIEFDERMWWVIRALGVKNYVFKSKPMTLTNTTDQLKAIELSLTNKLVEGEATVLALNNLTGLHLKYEAPPEEPEPATKPNIDPITNLPYQNPVQPVHPNDPRHLKATGGKFTPDKVIPHPEANKPNKAPVTPRTIVGSAPVSEGQLLNSRKVDSTSIVKLVDKWANVLGLSGQCTLTQDEVITVKSEVSSLSGDDQKLFNEILAAKSLVEVGHDLEGLAMLCGHAGTMSV